MGLTDNRKETARNREMGSNKINSYGNEQKELKKGWNE